MSEPRRRGMSLDEMIGFEDKSRQERWQGTKETFTAMDEISEPSWEEWQERQERMRGRGFISSEKAHEMELRTGVRGLTYLVPGMNTSAGSLANPTVHLSQKLTLEAEVRIRDLGEGLWAMSDLAEKEMDEMWREEKDREKEREAQNESAGKRSPEEHTKDGAVSDLLGKERTTSEREVASHTAGRSEPDAPKVLG
jgi:hypothetical protein